MKGFVIFLLLIPFLAALGHDIYYFYEHQDEGFKLSELGWLWTTYHGQSHDQALEYFGLETWTQFFIPVLSLYSVIVALIFAGIILFFMFIGKIFGAIANRAPRRRISNRASGRASAPHKVKTNGKSHAGSLGRDRGEAKKFKYNRR